MLIGVGAGGQVAKQAYKESLKQALKGKMAKNKPRDIRKSTKGSIKKSFWSSH